MSRRKLHVRSGDQVLILAGKDRGKKGKVLQVSAKTDRVLVEGVNLIKKAMRPTEDNPEGGIIEKEAALHISNVKVVESAGKKEAE
ncbi:MAG: 50S ribosomal protein L24 [Verrucomicrobia bacterium]|nr:50S ribosomal protein L24 [Verrucomicrobiota bacterium]MCH8528500.1 50S ribosomal protein L24 [Kiritimatiellia bacterium]